MMRACPTTLALLLLATAAQGSTLIENVSIVDGTGSKAQAGAVRVDGERIEVLLDPREVADRATLKEPTALSVGIRQVWVNGQLVYENGRATGKHPGRVIRPVPAAAN